MSGNVGSFPEVDKNILWISKVLDKKEDPVFHFCTDLYYQNTVRAEQGLSLIAWVNAYTYADLLVSDGCYPGLVSDNAEAHKAYLAVAFTSGAGPQQGIYLNIMRSNSLIFNPNSLLCLDANGSTGAEIFPPQMYPAQRGGTWMCYTKNGYILISYIPSDVNSAADCSYYTVSQGTRGTICVDDEDNIHLTYDNNGFKYRKLTVVSSEPTPTPVPTPTPGPSPPPPPRMKSATGISVNGFTANWYASDSATNYLLDISYVSDFSIYLAGYSNSIAGNVLSKSVNVADVGSNTYYYRVGAVNSYGESVKSSVISVQLDSSSLGWLMLLLE